MNNIFKIDLSIPGSLEVNIIYLYFDIIDIRFNKRKWIKNLQKNNLFLLKHLFYQYPTNF